MAYATVADLVARYTEPTIAGLTDLTRLGSVNAEIAQQGLDDASAEIDGYLASRYELPLPAPVRLLSLYCCDIAVYRLATGKRQLTEDMVHDMRRRLRISNWWHQARLVWVWLKMPTPSRPCKVMR